MQDPARCAPATDIAEALRLVSLHYPACYTVVDRNNGRPIEAADALALSSFAVVVLREAIFHQLVDAACAVNGPRYSFNVVECSATDLGAVMEAVTLGRVVKPIDTDAVIVAYWSMDVITSRIIDFESVQKAQHQDAWSNAVCLHYSSFRSSGIFRGRSESTMNNVMHNLPFSYAHSTDESGQRYCHVDGPSCAYLGPCRTGHGVFLDAFYLPNYLFTHSLGDTLRDDVAVHRAKDFIDRKSTNSVAVAAHDASAMAALFPAASEYLSALPKGILSYPDCQITAEYAAILRHEHPALFKHPALPSELRAVLGQQWNDEQWISQVTANLAVLLVYDGVFNGDETAFSEWTFQMSKRLYLSPLNRALMAVLSPRTIVQLAFKRWSRMHKLTTLNANHMGGNAFSATLHFPPNVYARQNIVSLAAGYRAAIVCAGAIDSDVKITACSATDATFVGAWEQRQNKDRRKSAHTVHELTQ